MTLTDLSNILAATNLPVAYDFFPEETFPGYPFVVYREVETDNFIADGVVYHIKRKVEVQLYTIHKDIVTEELVEDALQSIPWNKHEEYIDGEKCYQITFDITI